MRGATRHGPVHLDRCSISIHAPRAGSDAEGIHPSEDCEECFAVCGGCDPLNSPTGCDNEIDAFAGLWDRTVKPADLPLYGWEANPWVFVIEFERISKDEALGGGGDAN